MWFEPSFEQEEDCTENNINKKTKKPCNKSVGTAKISWKKRV